MNSDTCDFIRVATEESLLTIPPDIINDNDSSSGIDYTMVIDPEYILPF
jgi:hypothetical protein